ncbi:hypothetical protein [Janibacter corallicola]|uniref:hypothetical protein n=1 Tax=Janibacter corallicola TaxID=415212 RepID=UPI00082D1019|nr:hypothetical protein [Janibacter corallicola]
MSGLVPFGPGSAWLAVRGKPQAEVVEALGLTGGRVAEVAEAVRATGTGATAVLPPLPGVDGRWTLVVGGDAAGLSRRRVEMLSAMMSTQVQAFASSQEDHHWLIAERGGLRSDQPPTGGQTSEADVLATAAAWSIDPSTLSGPAPGSAVLIEALHPEAPTPENEPGLVQVSTRPRWLRRILGR